MFVWFSFFRCRFLPTSILSLSFSFRIYLLFISIAIDGLNNRWRRKKNDRDEENFSHIFRRSDNHHERVCVRDVIQSRLKCIFISYGSYKCFHMPEKGIWNRKTNIRRKAHIFGSKRICPLYTEEKKTHTHALIVFMGLECLSIWIRSSFAHIQFTHAIHTFYDSILCRKLKSLCDSVFFCCCCCSCRLWFKSYLFVDSVACAYLSALERFFSRNKIHFCRMYLWCCSIFLWAFFVRLEIGIIAE